jgi:hypothetical protein
VDTKQIRKDNQTDFKQGKIDLLIVYNMLLTGFDAKRFEENVSDKSGERTQPFANAYGE